MSLFKFISQKIKGLYARVKKAFLKLAERQNTVPRIEPKKRPIDDLTVKYALNYIFSIAGSASYEKGAGIIVKNIDELRERNTFSALVCTAFRYITVYTKCTESANEFADYVYERYGLPVMVMSIEEASRCRYPVIIDFVRGKVRYGRDVCVDGTLYGADGKMTGLTVGARIIKIDTAINKSIDN